MSKSKCPTCLIFTAVDTASVHYCRCEPCDLVFCLRCHHSRHFPASCAELSLSNECDEIDFEKHRKFVTSMTNIKLSYQNAVVTKDRFGNHPDLKKAIQELIDVSEMVSYTKLHLRLNPGFSSLERALVNLERASDELYLSIPNSFQLRFSFERKPFSLLAERRQLLYKEVVLFFSALRSNWWLASLTYSLAELDEFEKILEL